MAEKIPWSFGPIKSGLVAAVLFGVLAAGCQDKPSQPASDRKALEREAEKLKQQHEREWKNK
jgi:hypothetical protein